MSNSDTTKKRAAKKAPAKKVQKGKTGKTGGMMTFDEGDDEDDVF